MNKAKFSVEEIIKVTEGTLLRGDKGGVVEGVSTDSRHVEEKNLFVPLKGDKFDGHAFISTVLEKRVPAIIVSEKDSISDLDLTHNTAIILVDDTLAAYQAIAKFHRKRFRIPVVGITGTNGKSTTKEMVAAVLSRRYQTVKNEANFNNHIGVPKTLFALSEDTEVLVTEMGMSASGEIKTLCKIAGPTIGIITNISMGHLEGLGSIEAIRDAKGELIDFLRKDSVAILNADDENVISLANRFKGKVITFGISSESDLKAVDITRSGSKYSFKLTYADKSIAIKLKDIGYHNIYNALAAASVGIALGMELEDIVQGLDQHTPLSMRMEFLKLGGGIKIINDAYNANPASMSVAIATLNDINSRGKKVLIAGDMLELGSEAVSAHMELGRKVASSVGIDRFYGYGKLAAIAAGSAIQSGMKPDSVISSDSYKDIVLSLNSYLRDGDIVLLKGSRGNKLEEVIIGLSKVRGYK